MEIWLTRKSGNYDYLMYADIDFKHPEVVENLDQWAEWFIETTGVEDSVWMQSNTLTPSL